MQQSFITSPMTVILTLTQFILKIFTHKLSRNKDLSLFSEVEFSPFMLSMVQGQVSFILRQSKQSTSEVLVLGWIQYCLWHFSSSLIPSPLKVILTDISFISLSWITCECKTATLKWANATIKEEERTCWLGQILIFLLHDTAKIDHMTTTGSSIRSIWEHGEVTMKKVQWGVHRVLSEELYMLLLARCALFVSRLYGVFLYC